MDSESLRTASTYLNNLLLARGSLRNGEPIDFVKPSRESRAQIINLVHDLILRGDRDKEQREQLSASLRRARADDERRTHDLERLTARHDEAARAVVQAQAAERAARDDGRKADKLVRGLQEQGAKLRATLAQVKTQCANDVRKRDLELARLKAHLQGQQRGNKAAVAAPSVTVTGAARRPALDASVRDLGDLEYSLKQETTEFLTRLSQSLSDENDNLIGLVRGAIGALKELLGLPESSTRFPDSGIGEDVAEPKQGDQLLHALPTSYEALAADLESALAHLKTLLTNPNFVPLEEVEVREEELARLREGWEKMEQRWKGLLVMMEGWRQRMDTGDTINIDDLRRGMGLVSPDRPRGEAATGAEEAADESSSSIEDSINDIRTGGRAGQHTAREGRTLADPAGLYTHAAVPLRISPKRKRDVLEPPESFDLRPRGPARVGSHESHESVEPQASDTPRRTTSARVLELPDEVESEELEVPRMTVEEKLGAAAREAAAAVRVTCMQGGDGSRRRGAGVRQLDGVTDDMLQDEDTLGRMPSPVRKTRIRGRPRRRKSTLSRDELAELLLSAEGGPPERL